MNKLLCLAAALLPPALINFAFAQAPQDVYRKHIADSMRLYYTQEAAVRNPALRQVVITTDIVGSSNFDGEYLGNKVLDGRFRLIRTTALFTAPLKRWGKNSVSGTASFFQQRFGFSNVNRHIPNMPEVNGVINKFTVGISANYTRLDSLFGHPVIYTAAITGITGQASSIQRLSYLGGVIYALKQTRSVRASIGVLLNVDPSVNVPVVPLIMYWRSLNSTTELNVNLPQQAMLRKTVSKSLWATFGSSLSGSVAFFRLDQPNLPYDANYSTLDFKTGLGIETRFGKLVMFGVNAGILAPVQARMFGTSDKSNDYFFRNRLNTTPYINFNLSVLPFIK